MNHIRSKIQCRVLLSIADGSGTRGRLSGIIAVWTKRIKRLETWCVRN